MASVTDQMGLFVWDGPNDPYDYQQLVSNWQKINFHDHTPGHGVPIGPGGIATGAVSLTNLDTSATNYIASQGLTVRAGGVSGSTNAAPGELLIVTGGQPLTVTLPTPTANAKVAIAIKAGGSFSTPVTIAASGGALIYGPQMIGVSSFLLAQNGAYVVLETGGTNWTVIGGGQDNGGYISTGSPITAAHGQVINATGTTTVTLPGTPATGTTITVRNANVSSGVITVSAGTGSIFGRGCFGVTSIPLGAVGSFVTLVGDPSGNWAIVAGKQDSGWNNAALVSPWVSGNAASPPLAGPIPVLQYRLIEDIVIFRGQAYTASNTGNNITVMPAGYRPVAAIASYVQWPQAGLATDDSVQINGTTGAVFPIHGGVAGSVLDLTGFQYFASLT